MQAKNNKKVFRSPSDKIIYELSDFFKNFGESTRLKIVMALMNGELCVADIAEAVGSSVSAVSHQLRVLRQGKIVKSERDGNMVFYSIDDDHVQTLVEVGLEHILERKYGK
ncbi:MAG: metalloregulator ArsR/SmtB family transcription factor [Treponemataceae bacterium]